MERENK